MVGGNTMKTSETRRKKGTGRMDRGRHRRGPRPSMGLRREVWVGVSPDRNGFGGCDLIQVAVRPDVRVVKGKMSNKNLALLRQWVDLNRDMIVKFWNTEEIEDSLAVY